MRATLGALVGALLVPALALAQQPPPDTLVVPVPEVVVTALRGGDRLRQIPAAAFVLGRQELARSAAPRLSTLLSYLPGLYGYQSGATGDPTVVDPRGFTANGETSYLKVLVNGRDTRDLENGNVDWDWLGPESVQRVEVIEGSGAWLYGDGAAGGIVNVVRQDWRPGFRPTATVRGGSFDHQGLGFGISGGGGNLGGALGGGGRDVDGWRDRSRERVRRANALGTWEPWTSGSLGLDVAWLRADRQDPGALTPEQIAEDRTQAENPGDFANSERLLASLTLAHGEPDRGRWSLSPYARFEEVDQVRTILFEPLFHPTSGTTAGAELEWKGEFQQGPRALQLSASYQIEGARLRTRYYDESPRRGGLRARGLGERLTHALFAAARYDLTSALTGRLGLRGDILRVEFDDRVGTGDHGPRTISAVSPFAALSARLGDAVIHGSVGGAFHAPTLNQLYDQRPFLVLPFPPFTISNAELDPQRSVGFELGGRWDSPAGPSASLTLYDVYVRDEIDFDAATFSYANIGKSRHAGGLGWARWPLPGRVAVVASGTVSPTLIREGPLDGNQINAVPLGSASGRLQWEPFHGAAVEGGVRWVAKQYLDKENAHPLPEYAVADVAAAVHHGRLRASVRVANLFDREFSDTGFIGAVGEERLVPAAPRSVSFALTFE